MMQVMLQVANSLDSNLYPGNTTPSIFTEFYAASKYKTVENPIHKTLLSILILIMRFVGFFSALHFSLE